ncbi:MAG: N-6 DNA methylase, partial [Thermomicrobiales bacterium]|nr:N-6 DNA methylase [Thermomicrobiales bacterium]
MTALESGLRKQLERAVVRARDEAEAGARAALQTLAVREREAFASMDPAQRDLRTALRAKAKNLGEGEREAGYAPLIEEIAYEQWHRLLFARFLAENRLLMHPMGAPLSLEECAELAASEGAENGWDLAGRYAARMLPGIFRAGDPAAQVLLAREHRAALEALVAELPRAVFTSDDGLGWTYQFWQAKRKNEVNASGVKIGARELAPVTQLFTEDYMVRFLLENSLGAWWAARHPGSPLLAEMAYLRFGEDGAPAAGSFPGWPQAAAEVTVMDPCCGSGHFLTRAFHLLRAMRMEEEGLDAAAAGDAVLRDNLFGLELDERCVQIAAFALALEAWKSGGYRAIPAPQGGCIGEQKAGQLEDWLKLAGEDVNLRETLRELYRVFEDAPELGSLIDPKRIVSERGLFAPHWDIVEEVLVSTFTSAMAIAASAIGAAVAAAKLLGGTYTLVVTNPPYLNRGAQTETVKLFNDKYHRHAKADLATVFLDRCRPLASGGGSIGMVTPQNWLFLKSYFTFRSALLKEESIVSVARLGAGAFETISGEVVNTALVTLTHDRPFNKHTIFSVDVSSAATVGAKGTGLSSELGVASFQADQIHNPDSRITTAAAPWSTNVPLLGQSARCMQGIITADIQRFVLRFWELAQRGASWDYYQRAPQQAALVSGWDSIVRWEQGSGPLATSPQARICGNSAWGTRGVGIGVVSALPRALYSGSMFDCTLGVLVPTNEQELDAITAYALSPEFVENVRVVDQALSVTESSFVKVPFDLEHWSQVAAERYPDGLPPPYSNDATQWLFNGHPVGATEPLQVAVARLLGYRWPQNGADDLAQWADGDGIVCLPPVAGEQPAHERLRTLLAHAYAQPPTLPDFERYRVGDFVPTTPVDPAAGWSLATQQQLLASVGYGGQSLEAWLRDGFFQHHCALFHNRPFIWHIWDG